jgi:predicted PurR-regulated permease PerM
MMSSVLSTPLLVRILLALVLAAAIYFFSGFIVPVLAALILGFATWPLYARLVKACRGSSVWAATIALLIVTVGVVVPLTFVIYYAVGEASSFIRWLLIANREGITAPAWITALPLIGENLAGYWNGYLSSPHAISNMTEMISGQHIANIYRAVLSTTGGLFSGALFILFSLMTLFFVYKDGHHLVTQLDVIGERILANRWQHFSRVVPATISSTVTGMGLIAIGEGVILGAAYWIAGVPSPVLLGLITAVMAMIPGGAPLCFTLVSIYLVGSGDAVAGIVLFLWGTIELFIVDKTLRPRLVGGPVKLPFLPTFFGLVGGVQTMGFVGLFIGPVLMALIVAMWREWVFTLQTHTVNSKSDQTQSFHQPK